MFPKINGMEAYTPGAFVLRDSITADPGDFAPEILEVFRERTEISRIIVSKGAGREAELVLQRDASLPDCAYRIRVEPETITVCSAESAGMIEGLTTLFWLKNQEKIPCCEIEDTPKCRHRGISLDTSRHFFDAAEVKRIIEQMSLVKMNVLHWHLSDDQGFRIESRRFPKLNEVCRQYYTQDEIRDIVSYAAVRGVGILPEIDMPGHTRAILAAYPEYGCSRKPVEITDETGIFADILCAGREETYEMLSALLSEICPLFPGTRFHIGGDEAPYSHWKVCPDCRKRMEEEGITDYTDLQGYFTQRICGLLGDNGKTPVCWNEVLHAKMRPKDLTVQFWSPEQSFGTMEYIGSGGALVYSNMYELYLDYPHSMTGLRKIYDLKPCIGEKDISDLPGFLGFESPIWTEQISTAEVLEKRLFPRAWAVAELGWCGRCSGDYDSFRDRLSVLARYADRTGIAVTPREWWDPEGEERLQEALTFLTRMYSGVNESVEEPKEDREIREDDDLRFLQKMFFREGDMPAILNALQKLRENGK